MTLIMSCPAIFYIEPGATMQSLFFAKPATAAAQATMEFYWLFCD